MKIKHFLGLTALTSLAFTSCCNEETNEWKSTDPIQFSTAIATTRVTDNAWNGGEKVGIFMKAHNGNLTNAQSANMQYQASMTGELTHTAIGEAIYFPSDGSQVDFVAYYPFTSNLKDNSLAIDVADQTKELDLLYATNNTGLSNTSSSKVSLNFEHKLARIVLNIKNETSTRASDIKVSLAGTDTKATFDLANAALATQTGSAATINCKMTAQTNTMKAEAIVLPVEKLGSTAELIFTIGTETYKHSLAGSALNASTSYSYEATITDNSGKPAVIVGQATITDWIKVSGGDINIDLGGGNVDPDPDPEDPQPGVEQTIFEEGFGDPQKKTNKYWPSINEYTGWDNSTFTFTDNLLGSNAYSTASVRSTSALNGHVWFASGKDATLEIKGFSTTGYTKLKLSYDIAANSSANQNAIVVKCGTKTMTVPSVNITTANTYQTVQLSDLPEGLTSIEFISNASANSVGFRVDNVKLVGTK